MNPTTTRLCLCALTALGSHAAMAALPPPTLERDGIRCWHDIAYGPRGDLAGEGEEYTASHGGWSHEFLPWKFHRHRSGQFLDVYAPSEGIRPDATILLFLHGGSWSECYDKDAPPYDLFKAVAAAGGIGCTVDYILQNDRSQNWLAPVREGATFAEMLRDIDAAVSKIAEVARELGVATPRLVVAGESAGGHLALLYSYDLGKPERLGLELAHALPVAKIVNIVGPTDFTAREFEELGTVTVLGVRVGRNPMQVLINRLMGLPDHAPARDFRAAAAKWSPIKFVCADSPPTAVAYGAIGPDETSDGLIPVSQMTSLEAALKAAGVPCTMKKCSGLNHGEVTWRETEWIAEQVLAR